MTIQVVLDLNGSQCTECKCKRWTWFKLNRKCCFPAEDTSPVHAGNFEVVQQLHHLLSVGVIGVTVSHLQHRDTAGRRPRRWVGKKKVQRPTNPTTIVALELKTTYRLEQLDLIQGRFCVMFCTLHNLHCHKALLPAQPPHPTTWSSYRTHRNHMSEVHKHRCVLTRYAKTHWRLVQSLSLDLLTKFCKSMHKSAKK